MTVRVGTSLQNHVPVADNLALARLAEELGLDEVWLNENGHHRAAFATAAAVASTTRSLGIGIGVVNPFHRHPSVIAMEAATVDELSLGRLRLGLGASLWNLRNLGEADPRTARPLTATVEAIRVIRALLRGEPVGETEIFQVSPDARLDFEPYRRDLPVYAGAVNARMLRATAAVADAVELGAIASLGYVRWCLERLAEGAGAAGRDLDGFDVAAPLFVHVDRDAAVAREAVRPRLAFYLGRVEPVVLGTAGLDPELVDRVRRDILDDGATAAGRIPDAVVDAFTVAGDPEHVARRLEEYVRLGLRGLILQNPGGARWAAGLRLFAEEVLPHVRALSPA